MDLNLLFALLGSLLVLAFLANRLVHYTGVPDVLVLMATGVVIGPVLHLVKPELFRGVTHGFGSLALMLILFEGGLDLKIGEILRHFAGGFFLSIFSFALSALGTAVVCRMALDFRWIPALLVGAVLGCLSSSILLPVLQQTKLRREVKVLLLVEASLGDAIAVLAVSTLLDLANGGSTSPRAILAHLGMSLLIAIAAGMAAGFLWARLLPLLSEQRFWHVLTSAAVLLVYSGVHAARGNELVGVLVFGLALSNFPYARRRVHLDEGSKRSDWFAEVPVKAEHAPPVEDHQAQMLTFHGELAFLIRTFFFVLLGSLVEFSGLRRTAVLALGCFGALFLARWFAVQSGRLAWRTVTSEERELMIWFLPRGLITAVLGIRVLEGRGAEFEFLPSLAFAIILLTNLLLLVGIFRARRIAARIPISSLDSAAVASDSIA
jgi:cell volume regulation protein A